MCIKRNSLSNYKITHNAWYLQLLLNERKLFTSSIAHDLKAPASTILTYIAMIKTSDSMINPEIVQYLNTIENKAVQLQEQIQKLQEFNLETTDIESPISIDFNEFLSKIYENTKPYADAVGIYFNLELPKYTTSLLCQPCRLARALENIILNATSFTAANGNISLQAYYQSDEAIIHITDTGQGIAAENIESIFDYRFSTNNNGNISGSRGLGLYFAKLAIQELCGNISVASELGKGSTFCINIPLKKQ